MACEKNFEITPIADNHDMRFTKYDQHQLACGC